MYRPRRRPRVVMTLLVRDEADIIAATIEHHLATGVNFIVATDNGSVDGTTGILAAYEEAGVLELIHDAEHDHEQGRRVTRMARKAASNHGADWIINCDADEFFWPYGVAHPDSTGIADSFAALSASCNRFWAWPKELVAHPDLKGSWADRLIIRDNESLMPDGSPYGAKCCHRADPDITVGEGNHIAYSPRIGSKDFSCVYTTPEQPLELLHVRNRGYGQFRRKIINGASALERNARLPKEAGWQWRQDYDRIISGSFSAEYRSRRLTRERLQNGLMSGTLTYDTRLRDRLYSLLPQSILPTTLHECLTHNWNDLPTE